MTSDILANFVSSVAGSVGTANIADDAVTYAKMQDISATDKVLGRSTAGAGDVEEIACTAAGRALIDDASAGAQRTTLGVVIGTDVQAQDAELAAIAGLTSAADRLPYFTGLGTASLATFTAAGRALIDDADAAAQLVTLGAETASKRGAASGYASLDGSTHVVELPADLELLAIAGLTSAADKLPYFTGLGTAALADFTAAGRALVDDAAASDQRTTLGLGSVDNTSDAAKPVSTATQTALDLKADIASPTFTGTPAAPTAAVGTNTTQVATTAYARAMPLNTLAPPTGSVDFSQQESLQFRIENRTDDPVAPAVGQIWLRTDL